MARHPYKIDSVRIAVIIAMYELYYENDDNHEISLENIHSNIFPYFSKNMINLALDKLVADGYAKIEAGTLLTGTRVSKINESGLRFMEGMLQDSTSEIYQYYRMNTKDRELFGRIFPPTDSAIDPINLNVTPQAADFATDGELEWEPLPLERGTPREQSAVSATEELLERVRGENGFAQSDPTRHEAIVWSLTTGLDAIKNRFPSRGQLGSLLLNPIRWLGEKFASSAIGELAKVALKHISDWIL